MCSTRSAARVIALSNLVLGVFFLGCLAGTASAIDFQVSLDANQEVPTPTLGGATPSGTATVSVNTITGDVDVVGGTYTGMTSNVVGSHLHGPADIGATAGVLIGLANTGGTSGTFSGMGTLGASDLAELLDGRTYLNIHTDDNGPGEIRGQVIDADIRVFDIDLTVGQEVPTPNTAGFSPSGSATVVVDTSTLEVEISGSYTGMTSNVVGSHLHGLADVGATAGVILGLDNTGGTSGTFSGMGTLSASDFDGLLNGLTYLNIHTDDNGPGEIRGQVVVPEPTTALLMIGAICSGIVVRRRA